MKGRGVVILQQMLKRCSGGERGGILGLLKLKGELSDTRQEKGPRIAQEVVSVLVGLKSS